MPNRQKVIKVPKIALIGTGITLVSLVAGIVMIRGDYSKRASRRARQVPERESDRKNIPKREETASGNRAAVIGAAAVIIAGFLTLGGQILTPYISRSAAPPPSISAPYNHPGFPSNHRGFHCGDDGQRQPGMLHPRAGRAIGWWPGHSSCPEMPQWNPAAKAA